VTNTRSYASSDLFVLLSWSCGVFTAVIKNNSAFGTDANAAPWRTLIGTIATLFDMLSASVKKASILQGALVRVRRAFRSVCCYLGIFFKVCTDWYEM
jgi:hypothetical protein